MDTREAPSVPQADEVLIPRLAALARDDNGGGRARRSGICRCADPVFLLVVLGKAL
jgi:hypothetical protein